MTYDAATRIDFLRIEKLRMLAFVGRAVLAETHRYSKSRIGNQTC